MRSIVGVALVSVSALLFLLELLVLAAPERTVLPSSGGPSGAHPAWLTLTAGFLLAASLGWIGARMLRGAPSRKAGHG